MFSSGGTETGSVSLRQPAQNVCGHIRSIQKFLTISVNGRYQYLRFPDQESTDADTELHRPRHIAGRSRNIPVPWIVQTRVVIYPDMPRQSVLRDDFLPDSSDSGPMPDSSSDRQRHRHTVPARNSPYCSVPVPDSPPPGPVPSVPILYHPVPRTLSFPTTQKPVPRSGGREGHPP